MAKILLMHGINHAMFGKRNPKYYGTITLQEIEDKVKAWGEELGHEVECFQSDIEGEMAIKIHDAYSGDIDAIVINAGAWTHYSYGILDALDIFREKGPIIETHMSNIHAREEFRHKSVFASAVAGQICGFGGQSYELALRALAVRLNESEQE